MTGRELDREVLQELSSLSSLNATQVAKHLVMAGRTVDTDPETAYAHAVAAQRTAARLGAVREAVRLTAYLTGRYAEALAELRAARRITGANDHLPIMADCERGLGRPERALELAGSDEARRLDRSARIEMRLVSAGARGDLGQRDAAVVTLQVPELEEARVHPWSARLRYAYADALLAAGRAEEGREWMGRALEADLEGETDAGERLAALDGMSFLDALEPDDALDPDEALDPDVETPAPAQGSDDDRPGRD